MTLYSNMGSLTPDLQYIDVAGKLRILQFHLPLQKTTVWVSLIVSPHAPLWNVPRQTDLTVHATATKEQVLQFTELWTLKLSAVTATGVWADSSIFGFCYLPFGGCASETEEAEDSELWRFRRAKQLANIYMQAALFVASTRPNDSPDTWFEVIPQYGYSANLEVALSSRLDFDVDALFSSSKKLIVPSDEFVAKLKFFVQRTKTQDPAKFDRQKQCSTVPDFFQNRCDFKPKKKTRIFASKFAVQEWMASRKTVKYPGKKIAQRFRPAAHDLAFIRFLETEIQDSRAKARTVAEKQLKTLRESLMEPYFFSHYRLENDRLALVQNVQDGEYERALHVASFWHKNSVNLHDAETSEASDVTNIRVYSPEGEVLQQQGDENQVEAYLIRYLPDSYAALLFLPEDEELQLRRDST